MTLTFTFLYNICTHLYRSRSHHTSCTSSRQLRYRICWSCGCRHSTGLPAHLKLTVKYCLWNWQSTHVSETDGQLVPLKLAVKHCLWNWRSNIASETDSQAHLKLTVKHCPQNWQSSHTSETDGQFVSLKLPVKHCLWNWRPNVAFKTGPVFTKKPEMVIRLRIKLINCNFLIKKILLIGWNFYHNLWWVKFKGYWNWREVTFLKF